MNKIEAREDITLYCQRLAKKNPDEVSIDDLIHFDALVCAALSIDEDENPPDFLLLAQK
jgi:hypothetical protein